MNTLKRRINADLRSTNNTDQIRFLTMLKEKVSGHIDNLDPDFVWIKERNGAADHGLYDAVRGVQKQMESNTITAESTETTGLTAFGTDGFTVGALAQLNTNTDTYVAWCWKANGAGSTNTAGTITSTVSANTTAGFATKPTPNCVTPISIAFL